MEDQKDSIGDVIECLFKGIMRNFTLSQKLIQIGRNVGTNIQCHSISLNQHICRRQAPTCSLSWFASRELFWYFLRGGKRVAAAAAPRRIMTRRHCKLAFSNGESRQPPYAATRRLGLVQPRASAALLHRISNSVTNIMSRPHSCQNKNNTYVSED